MNKYLEKIANISWPHVGLGVAGAALVGGLAHDYHRKHKIDKPVSHYEYKGKIFYDATDLPQEAVLQGHKHKVVTHYTDGSND